MQLIKFKIIYALLWLISILPWPIFYLLSDFLYFIIYRVVKYRKRIVMYNLTLAFPEKSRDELKIISKKFYSHMCDMFMEMVKSITISHKETQKRYKFKNLDVLRKLEAEERSFILLAAHYANYEWGNCIELSTSHTAVGVYKPIKNTHFNEFAKKIRGRFGSEVIPSKKIIRYAIEKERQKQSPRLYGLIADQSPRSIKDNFFVSFMGQEVPAFTGGEILAKKLDMPIYYLKVDKVKRGFYEAEIVLIDDDLSNHKNFEATTTYYKMLEDQIRIAPEYYLWTHKRWKHASNS